MKCFFGHKWDFVWRVWYTTITDYFGDTIPVKLEKKFRKCNKCGKTQKWFGGWNWGRWQEDTTNLIAAKSIRLEELASIKTF
jgi:hypothetical protein